MAATYTKYSPYYDTGRFGRFLDTWTSRPITKNNTDVVFTINAIYEYRPDLLANDLYGSPGLWWVFAARNPNIIQDPIFDFFSGQTIFIPEKAELLAALGI